MKNINNNLNQKALLIYINVDSLNKAEKLENSLDEFNTLVHSSGTEIIKTLKFNQKIPITSSFISKGKLDQIKNELLDQNIDLIIINHQLSASQNRNLEKFLSKRVIDKTELILDIFATRASSYIGNLQVELAQLNHLSTRLIRRWTHLERQKGGIGLRGPGETQLETDRRLIGKRIKR